MENKKDYKIPSFEEIEENGFLKVFSIFLFSGGSTELFPFLIRCREKNCTVIFENENITVRPDFDVNQKALLSFYAILAESRDVQENLIRYLTAKRL